MPYPSHHLLQFGGTLGSGEGDIWSCGIRLGEYGADPFGDLVTDEYLDETAVPALQTWISSANAQISVNAALTFAKCNRIGPDGRYAEPSIVFERFFAPVTGASSADPHPYQISGVYTWGTTEASRGPGSRGRIYTPMVTAAVVGSTGFMSINAATAMCQAAHDLINSLDAGISAPPSNVIRPSLVSPAGAGIMRQIDLVSVDTRLDVQRRRANALDPQRVELPVLY